jgi:hypothetical protein
MAKKHGKDSRIYVDSYDISGDSNKVDFANTLETAETSGFGQTSRTYLAGQGDGTVSVTSFWTDGAGGTDAILNAYRQGGDTAIVTYCPEGVADGAIAYTTHGAVCTQATYGSVIAEAVKAKHQWQTSGGRERMLVLAEGVYGSSAHGAGVDFGSAGVVGAGAAVIHVTSVTGSGTIDVHLEESSDNGSTDAWADEVGAAFTQLTGIGHEHITWAGALERYVRAEITISGFSAATLFVAAKAGAANA